jgi:hypothetical protein
MDAAMHNFHWLKGSTALISLIEGFQCFTVSLRKTRIFVMPIISSLARTIAEAMDHAWRLHCDVMQTAYQLDAAKERRDQDNARQEAPAVKRVWFGLL